MKELEVKAMLADPNIPDSYKLGGRLDERFLAGIEYAEAVMEKAPGMWVARDETDGFRGGLFLYKEEPMREEKYDMFDDRVDSMIELPEEAFPEVTWENSPRKVRLILEDGE
jgi:hypothetical protein